LDLQNDDGGWPTFCPGWGALPFDRSGADLTAHAVRALATWREAEPADRVDEAIRRGFDYLARQQRPDGSWVPLWFGNQHREDEENPVYGTARVLLAYRDLDRLASPPAQRGLRWLVANRHPSGGWGGPVAWQSGGAAGETSGEVSSIEETAVALEALLAAAGDPALQTATDQGLGWLVDRVEAGGHREAAPIGFYFARLWYYEALYPLVFSVAALGHALRRTASAAQPTPASPTSGHPDSAS
jgi:squalene-hopene/tetraprenyl-beta-curcumene cyclase